ncbi:MAG: hydrogenase maturation nickel metallochaperone HypA [Lachnospiraceae bacterium]|nr:hydrogenase maturation nickel metallochaperone HypA [Lachnospiraceae bacterium]
MHELPFVMKLLGETDAVASQQGFQRIGRIRIEVGALSGIEPECVRLYFETAGEGHAAEGAELEFVVDPAMLICETCGNEFAHEPERARAEGEDPFICPRCGRDGRLKKGTGSGARLLSVEGQ